MHPFALSPQVQPQTSQPCVAAVRTPFSVWHRKQRLLIGGFSSFFHSDVEFWAMSVRILDEVEKCMSCIGYAAHMYQHHIYIIGQ